MKGTESNKNVHQNKTSENNHAFLALIVGMFLGATIGGIIFFNLDHTKWPNPYGWWFPATFISTVVGAISGLLMYLKFKRKI